MGQNVLNMLQYSFLRLFSRTLLLSVVWSNRPLTAFLFSRSAVSRGVSSSLTRNRSSFCANSACFPTWAGRKQYRILLAITKAHLYRTPETGRSFSLSENTLSPAERSSRCVRAANRVRFVLFSSKNSTEGNYFFETETGVPTAAIPTPTMARLCMSLR